MDHPTPAETQPPLTWRSQAWRLAVCALISALVWSQAIEGELESHRVLFWVEVLFGIAAYVLVVVRRRAPVTIAMVVALLSTFSGIAAGPATLAAVSVATQRVPWSVVLVGVTNVVAATTYTFYAPIELREPYWVAVVISNPLGFLATDAPGAGLGLIGLAERAELRGGQLEHGRRGMLFVLHGSIPWTT